MGHLGAALAAAQKSLAAEQDAANAEGSVGNAKLKVKMSVSEINDAKLEEQRAAQALRNAKDAMTALAGDEQDKKAKAAAVSNMVSSLAKASAAAKAKAMRAAELARKAFEEEQNMELSGVEAQKRLDQAAQKTKGLNERRDRAAEHLANIQKMIEVTGEHVKMAQKQHDDLLTEQQNEEREAKEDARKLTEVREEQSQLAKGQANEAKEEAAEEASDAPNEAAEELAESGSELGVRAELQTLVEMLQLDEN